MLLADRLLDCFQSIRTTERCYRSWATGPLSAPVRCLVRCSCLMALSLISSLALVLGTVVLCIGLDAPPAATGIGPPLATSTPLDSVDTSDLPAGPSQPVSNC